MRILRSHPGGQAALVSHKATIHLLLSSLLGFDPRRYRDNLDQFPAAFHIVESRGLTCNRLVFFDDVSHDEAGDNLPPLA